MVELTDRERDVLMALWQVVREHPNGAGASSVEVALRLESRKGWDDRDTAWPEVHDSLDSLHRKGYVAKVDESPGAHPIYKVSPYGLNFIEQTRPGDRTPV